MIGCDSAKELAFVCKYGEEFLPSKRTVPKVDTFDLILSNNVMEIAKEP
jgi:hypothetical protein